MTTGNVSGANSQAAAQAAAAERAAEQAALKRAQAEEAKKNPQSQPTGGAAPTGGSAPTGSPGSDGVVHRDAFVQQETHDTGRSAAEVNRVFDKYAKNGGLDAHQFDQAFSELTHGAVLKRGGGNPSDVQHLQTELNKHLPHDQQLAVDGKFGPKTEAALKEYQKANGLQPTGTFDQSTQDVLTPSKGVQQAETQAQVSGNPTVQKLQKLTQPGPQTGDTLNPDGTTNVAKLEQLQANANNAVLDAASMKDGPAKDQALALAKKYQDQVSQTVTADQQASGAVQRLNNDLKNSNPFNSNADQVAQDLAAVQKAGIKPGSDLSRALHGELSKSMAVNQDQNAWAIAATKHGVDLNIFSPQERVSMLKNVVSDDHWDGNQTDKTYGPAEAAKALVKSLEPGISNNNACTPENTAFNEMVSKLNGNDSKNLAEYLRSNNPSLNSPAVGLQGLPNDALVHINGVISTADNPDEQGTRQAVQQELDRRLSQPPAQPQPAAH